MKIKSTFFVVEVPAGKYFLGDPCYAVADKDWHGLLDSCGYFEDSPIGTIPNTDRKVLAFSTMYGDGSYQDQYGNEYGVDAGMIGLTPLVDEFDKKQLLESLGLIVEFTRPTKCSNKTEGVLEFGKYSIDTN